MGKGYIAMNRISKLSVTMLSSLLLTLSNVSVAEDKRDQVLTIDRTVINSSQIQFPNEKNINPKVSSFKVVNYVLMSSPLGERWASVTLRNEASGSRKFDSGKIMALLANGDRVKPHSYSYMFDGNQTLTLSLNFGVSKFPLLEVYTRVN